MTANVDFEECQFGNCGTNTININIPSETELTNCPFKFNKNTVMKNDRQLIKGINVQSSIEFTGNTFQENDLTEPSFHFYFT